MFFFCFECCTNPLKAIFWHVSALLNLKILLLHALSLGLKPNWFQAASWVDTQHTTDGIIPKLGNYLCNQCHSFWVPKNHWKKKKKKPTSNFIFAEHNRRPSREREREGPRYRESLERDYESATAASSRLPCYWQSSRDHKMITNLRNTHTHTCMHYILARKY